MSNTLFDLADADGLLFIGDPHVWSSKKTGRRLDSDFCLTVCNKLEQAIDIANENNLMPIILGDLLEDENDDDPFMLIRLIRIFKKSKRKPLTLIGNHEKKQNFLTDDTALALLREADVLLTLERSGLSFRINCANVSVGIGGSPYGQPIPSDITLARTESGVSVVFWLTHHDLGFLGCYPGADELPEIQGVDYLVNGHMHKPAPPVQMGQTLCFNPGNITRMSVDCRNQIPCVYSWTPQSPQFKPIALQYQNNIFDLTGLLLNASDPTPDPEQTQAALDLFESGFARLLRQQQIDDRYQSDDATFLKEDLAALFIQEGANDILKADILGLLEKALSRQS